MKEIVHEYGSMLLSVLGATAALALFGGIYLASDGAFAGLFQRFTAYLF